MGQRHGLLPGLVMAGLVLAGLGCAIASLPASAQTSAPQTPAPKNARPTTAAAKPHSDGPRTLNDALAATYTTQPALLAERAKLRATDESVAQALSGWRPNVALSGTTGSGDGLSRAYSNSARVWVNSPAKRNFATAQATVTQNLYTGGRIQGNVNRSKNLVMAERATLITQEQTSFVATVTAYVGVIQARQVLELQRNNEQVLAKQLQATNDRYRVGEITRTDVAQAEAALAGARAQRETAEGNLAIARGTFQQIVGVTPPEDMVEPQPLALPVRSEADASALASRNNPQVITALFNDAAAKDAVDVALGALHPQVQLQGQTFQQQNSGVSNTATNGYQLGIQLSVPIYQGGAEYAAVRSAKQTQQQTERQIDDVKRAAVQAAVTSYSTLSSARAAAASTRTQIRSNETALEGVTREAIVGSRTTLDVLNAQQALLNSRTTLVQNLSQLVTASYQVAQAIGRLTARDMRLPVPLYDETAYYREVAERWIGLGDHATDQPAR